MIVCDKQGGEGVPPSCLAAVSAATFDLSTRAGCPCHAQRHGFTFIEILATLVLLAIVLPSVMNGITLCVSTADFAKRSAQASALCHNKLTEMLSAGDWQHGDMSGDFGTDWPDFRWTAQVSDFNGTVLKSIDVTVSWRQNNRDRSVALSTLVYTGSAS